LRLVDGTMVEAVSTATKRPERLGYFTVARVARRPLATFVAGGVEPLGRQFMRRREKLT